ncbi:MAG: FlgD immunoglobulin-like domain containing protein [Candidatus Gracilibacteria bacterium]|jgi:flagellar hook assembly protein FlgD|nr:FlgD immunoglobulin-like domain containing protein [Candidatus Gracilibacteria bacterium]
MMKKLLSLLVAVSMLSSTAAYAVGIADGGSGSVTDYISSLTVSRETVNPAQNLSTTVNVSLANTASIYVYVLNASFDVVTTLKTNGILTPGTYSYEWNGTVSNIAGGTALSDGTYTIRAFAYSTVDGSVVDYAYQRVTLDNEGLIPPVATLDLSGLTVSPSSFVAGQDTGSTITFNVNQAAYVDVEVRSGSTVVKQFANYNGSTLLSNTSYSMVWDGKNDSGSYVSNGTYTVYASATNSNGTDSMTASVTVGSTSTSSDLIKNFTLNPSSNWDPSEDDELEIEFELTDDVEDLTVVAKKGSKTVEIIDEEDASEDDYSETWDGTDDDGDDVETGTWEIRITADDETVSRYIDIVREKPEITEAFVTKTSIDNEIGEVTNLVFKVDSDAVVTVELYDGSKRLSKLLEDEDVVKNKWYSVEWDGTDEGDEVDEGSYTLKITAENEVDDDIYDTESVNVTVDEDTTSSSKSNITNDYTAPVVFDDKEGEYLTVKYCIDEDAEVFLAIYKGMSASGSTEIELMDYVDQNDGCHEVKWNVEDDNDKALKDGVYSYKLITSVDGKKETETGRFVVGNAGNSSDDDDDDDDNDDVQPVKCGSTYYDVTGVSPEMCEAITWTTNEGIFSGYSDGSFRPYQNINRAETLKVVFEAFRDKVALLPANGSTLGFKDVNPDGWYMTYARTAKFYGMLHGYINETEARFSNNINRAEFLKFALEASDAFTAWEIPGFETTSYADVSDTTPSWYHDYAGVADTYNLYNTYYDVESGRVFLRPGQLVQRGEVALLLYRMYLNGLLN